MAAPLAQRLRPKTLDEMVGQEHLLGPGGLLRRVAASGTLPNMIFYGPPGVGKTTAARIIAAGANKKMVRLNGTTASTRGYQGPYWGAGRLFRHERHFAVFG